tara:strand:+ start:3149 stop:4090 length:942 start_codon:yes stop_codon:yes gene_type:complete
MKKFVLKVFKSVLIINIMIVCLIIISFLKPSNYTYDLYQSKFFKIKTLDVGIYGDSHFLHSLDTKILSQNRDISLTNFSRDALPLFYTIRIIQNHINKNPNLKFIVDLGTNNLESSFALEGDKFSAADYTNALTNYYIYLNFNDLFSFLKKYPLLTIQSILKGSYQVDYFFNKGVNLSAGRLTEQQKKDYTIRKFKYDSIRQIKRSLDVEFELNELRALIKDNPQTKFLIISPPEHPLYLKMSNKENRFKTILKEFNAFENTSHINAKTLFNEDTLFADYSHLNNDGRVKFTKWLIKHLKFNKFLENKSVNLP